MNRIIRSLITVGCLFLHYGITAQVPELEPPVLEMVSVDPITGEVTITWQPSPSLDADGYYIYWLDESIQGNFAIDSVWGRNTTIYKFDPNTISVSMPNPLKTTVPFTVAAVRKTPRGRSLRTLGDYNMQVVSEYDSCRSEIKLSWFPYKGWSSKEVPYQPLICYRIMRIPNSGGTPEEVKLLSDQDTTYTISKINENEQYTYYIDAQRNDGLRSTSYKTEKFTAVPTPPTFINAEGTSYDAQGKAEITFSLDPSSQTYSYEFLGSSNPDYSFVSLGNYDNIMGSSLTLTDDKARGKTYYYKLSAWHVCKNKHTTESNVATALWLYVRQDDQINTLQWSSYADWGNPAQHLVHRQVDNKTDEIIATLTGTGSMTYQDDLTGKPVEGEICYWIEALPDTPGNPAQQGISNKICLQPESDIFIPEAFTPNGDGMNDEYKPYFSFPPQEYLMALYDRNGAKVFQTQDIGKGWDGHLKNNKPANEGVYGYYIKYRTAKGRLVEKRGTLTLVLP